MSEHETLGLPRIRVAAHIAPQRGQLSPLMGSDYTTYMAPLPLVGRTVTTQAVGIEPDFESSPRPGFQLPRPLPPMWFWAVLVVMFLVTLGVGGAIVSEQAAPAPSAMHDAHGTIASIVLLTTANGRVYDIILSGSKDVYELDTQGMSTPPVLAVGEVVDLHYEQGPGGANLVVMLQVLNGDK